MKNVRLFITDDLKGMAGAVQRFYPKARFQYCCVDVSRNISHKGFQQAEGELEQRLSQLMEN